MGFDHCGALRPSRTSAARLRAGVANPVFTGLEDTSFLLGSQPSEKDLGCEANLPVKFIVLWGPRSQLPFEAWVTELLLWTVTSE